ncbi:hypothetical protein ARMSODRAFT_101581 [Armillaria solidipes]|uniref:Uncharacterized protein n=1 Tax=Armillaria solidipes TaxID=1076256 RepID=A0A2H3AYB2_9AGAR|nr:hypothetical protein ARMSODRAFT_101581 [Armillaria solidipes]
MTASNILHLYNPPLQTSPPWIHLSGPSSYPNLHSRKSYSKNQWQKRSTSEGRLAFFRSEEWTEIFSPTSVQSTTSGKICQLDQGEQDVYPWPQMMNRKICVRMYAVWLQVRGGMDEVWLYRKQGDVVKIVELKTRNTHLKFDFLTLPLLLCVF